MLPILIESACETRVDICLIIDSSGSIRDNNPADGSYDNWQLQLEFLATLVDGFTIGPDASRVGAVSFSDIVLFEFPMNRYKDATSVKEAIKKIEYLGQTTATADGFRVSREKCFSPEYGDRPNVQNLAILITDGQPFPVAKIPDALEEAKKLQSFGVTMISIGVTDVINEELLRKFSSPPHEIGRNYFTALGFTDLDSIRANVKQETCERITGNAHGTHLIVLMHRPPVVM